MTEKQKKQLYESIMKSVAKTVKKTLNEFNVFGVEVTSLQQGKMSDIDDTDKPVKWDDKNVTKDIQAIYDKMKTNMKFKDFLKTNNAADQIEWSYKINTACTDGHTGRIIMNPEFMSDYFYDNSTVGIRTDKFWKWYVLENDKNDILKDINISLNKPIFISRNKTKYEEITYKELVNLINKV